MTFGGDKQCRGVTMWSHCTRHAPLLPYLAFCLCPRSVFHTNIFNSEDNLRWWVVFFFAHMAQEIMLNYQHTVFPLDWCTFTNESAFRVQLCRGVTQEKQNNCPTCYFPFLVLYLCPISYFQTHLVQLWHFKVIKRSQRTSRRTTSSLFFFGLFGIYGIEVFLLEIFTVVLISQLH